MSIVLYGVGKIGAALATLLPIHDTILVTRTHHEELAHHTALSWERDGKQPILDALKTATAVVVTITPHDGSFTCYPETAELIAEHAPHAHLIYTSSIGVYGSTTGNINESTPLQPTTERTKALCEAEAAFLRVPSSCIFRLGGIYGTGTSLLHYFTQKGCIGGSKKWPVNMIHKDDVVHAIIFALENSLIGTFNLVCEDHPTRYDAYTQAAETRGITLPTWDETLPVQHGGDRYISSEKLKKAGYTFLHPHLVFELL